MHEFKKARGLLLLPCVWGAMMGCAREAPPTEGAQPVSQPLESVEHSHPMTVHWVTHDSFKEMVGESGVIVQARVVSSRPAAQRVYGWNEKAQRYFTPEEAGDRYAETPLTVSTLVVSDVARAKAGLVALGGAKLGPDSKLEIVELGGLAPDGHRMEPDDKPVLRLAEEAIFFLIPAAKHPGAYHVLGGWQGRLRVTASGEVQALGSEVHPGLADFSVHDGRTAKALMDELRGTPR
ncbi:hypothetical protein MFUL124B02_11210 [Myxococcus fulvus 124B02]|nr:hypothetical protein MFUL124B02_11210 [Myxococcus fulvus 124B02]